MKFSHFAPAILAIATLASAYTPTQVYALDSRDNRPPIIAPIDLIGRDDANKEVSDKIDHTEHHTKELDAIGHHLNDYHETSVDFYQLPDEMTPYPHFLVEVDRHDVLTDVQDSDVSTEQIVAQKYTHIVLAFDVSPSKEVTVNGKPVPMGISHLTLEADTLQLIKKPDAVKADGNGRKIQMSKDDLMKSMDKGLIGVSLSVEAQTVHISDGIEFEQFKIAEMITEVNGDQVEQHRLMQQIVEVNSQGVVAYKMVKPSIETTHKLESLKHSKMKKLAAKCAVFVHGLSLIGSILLCVFLGFGFSAIVFAGAWMLNYFIVRRNNEARFSYGKIALTDEEELFKDEKLPIYDEVAIEAARSKSSEKERINPDDN